MPIMDGYTCCTNILKFFSMIDYDHTTYQEVLRTQAQAIESISDALNQLQDIEEDEEEQLSKFVKTYDRLKYTGLDNRKRPFLFAYSALINDDVEKRIKKCGFDKIF